MYIKSQKIENPTKISTEFYLKKELKPPISLYNQNIHIPFGISSITHNIKFPQNK